MPDGEIQFRISTNTGGGGFSQDWVSLKAIREALGKAKSEKSLTAVLLFPLYRGKSVNTVGG